MLHPQATYRIQFRPGFGFEDVAELMGIDFVKVQVSVTRVQAAASAALVPF